MTVDATLNPDGTIVGKLQNTFTNLYALNMAESYDSDPDSFSSRVKSGFKVPFTNLNRLLMKMNLFQFL